MIDARLPSPMVPVLTLSRPSCSADGRRDGSASLDAVAVVAHGFAHCARVDIVRRLAECGPLVVGEIVAGFGLAQSTVSEHLRVLRDSGIVVSERVGPRVRYRLASTDVLGVLSALAAVADRRESEGT
jgi:DNA-binding transcriptional ArsR family regulator